MGARDVRDKVVGELGRVGWLFALFALSVAAATAAWWVQIDAGTAATVGHRRGLDEVGISLLVIAALLTALRELVARSKARRRLEDIRTLNAFAMGDVIRPIAGLIGVIRKTPNGKLRSEMRGNLTEKVLAAAVQLCNADRSRAVWYELDGDDLRPRSTHGRGDPATKCFTLGHSPGGDDAHDMVRTNSHRFVRDTKDLPSDRMAKARPVRYRTYLSVAVWADDAPLGMITVDAPEPGDLTESDVDLVKTLANLLAAGLA